jgi:hypothetical protein
MADQQDKDAAHVLGGVPCRAAEFGRWNRALLQHERALLSKVMANQRAFITETDADAIMHDLQDIDFFLAKLGTDELIKADTFRPDILDVSGDTVPPIEMWPASEGPVRPSQRTKSAEGT